MPASVVVGAAEVIAALRADQLAVVTGEAVAAGGADLAVVDRTRRFRECGSRRITMREIHGKFRTKIRVEGVRAVREHGRQISMDMRQFPQQLMAGA